MLLRTISRFTSFFLLLAFTATAGADVVYLSNGDKLKGEITTQDGKSITLKTKYSVIRISKTKVTRIEKDLKQEERVNLYLKNGTVCRGVIVSQTPSYIVIRRKNGKKAIFLKENIARMDWGKENKKTATPGKENRSGKPAPNKTPGKSRPLPNSVKKRPPLKSGENSLSKFRNFTRGKIRLQSVWRSALLPSWGQFYQERKTMGWIWVGAMGISLIGMGYSYIGYRIEKKDWDAGDHSLDQYNRMEKKSDLYFAFSLAALSIWLLNIADAAIFSPEARKTGISASVSPDLQTGGIRSSIHIRF